MPFPEVLLEAFSDWSWMKPTLGILALLGGVGAFAIWVDERVSHLACSPARFAATSGNAEVMRLFPLREPWSERACPANQGGA